MSEKELFSGFICCFSYQQDDIQQVEFGIITKTILFLVVRNLRCTYYFCCFTKFWVYRDHTIIRVLFSFLISFLTLILFDLHNNSEIYTGATIKPTPILLMRKQTHWKSSQLSWQNQRSKSMSSNSWVLNNCVSKF